MGLTTEDSLTMAQLMVRFDLGGEWRPEQVASMCGWSRSSVYRFIDEGKFGTEGVVYYGVRKIRIKGAAIAQFLRKLQAR
jgi:hypothetical protein